MNQKRTDIILESAADAVNSILMAGVGGQGVLRASDILCEVLIAAGRDVKKSEVHGMAQRGGCVTSHIRYGRKVYSPIEKKGNVDILMAFESLESLRYFDYLKPLGRVIVNDIRLYPPAVNLGEMAYPPNAIDLVKERFADVEVVNARDMARAAGNLKTENTALLGVLSRWLDMDEALWEAILQKAFPPKVLDANLKAFHLGRGR